ncbi:MAG: phosphoribosyltransferase [Deltaproteobacteria bacterium]|nr:MAG: phosphoribosyltransferase [Deltaproteobacteria bacterium]
MASKIFEVSGFRDKRFVFKDRDDAGKVLAEMLSPYYEKAKETLVLAIPSGGVPIGLGVAKGLSLPLDLIIVRKIPVPGNPEAGFGALTLDGDVFLNEELVAFLRLSPKEIEDQITKVKTDLQERNFIFRQGTPFPDVINKTVLMADDGLASGYTMLACVETVRRKGASKIVVAVPTAPERSVFRISPIVEEVFCPNIRTGRYFAVADAYANWYDLTRNEVLTRLQEAGFPKTSNSHTD